MILSLGSFAALTQVAALAPAAGSGGALPGQMADTALWAAALIAVAGYAVSFAFSRQRVIAGTGIATAAPPWKVATWALLLAWAAHGQALVFDVFGGGVGARFGFAPALSATVWLVIGAHALEQKSLVLHAARRVLCVAGIVACVLAVLYPGEQRIAESPWAPLHWLLGIISYGLFGAAVVHAWLLDRSDKRMRRPVAPEPDASGLRVTVPLMTLERLTFRFVDAGFVVLTITLLLGGWFAMQTAGGWRWDHKTVFSLAGWLTFAFLVVGRHARGWRGRKATRWLYVGAVLLLLAYVGSRFVMEVLLNRSA